MSETANIFNSAIAAAAISALHEIGLFEKLREESSVDIDALCEERSLHRPSLGALLHTLHGFDLLQWCPDEGVVRMGPKFDDMFREKGYFLWLIRGYGEMLRNFASILSIENRSGDFVRRNGKYIAMAGGDYNAQFIDQALNEMLDEQPFTVGADLGCGSAKRLLGFANTRPGFRGVGVDIDEGGVWLARNTIAAEAMDDRITVIHGDVKKLEPCDAFKDVEVLFCFWMGHDLWPRSQCIEILNRIHEVFPRAERFILADTYRSNLSDASESPTFTLGFEVTHAFMGQYIPSLSEWEELFSETHWRYAGRRDVELPYSSMFDLRRS